MGPLRLNFIKKNSQTKLWSIGLLAGFFSLKFYNSLQTELRGFLKCWETHLTTLYVNLSTDLRKAILDVRMRKH